MEAAAVAWACEQHGTPLICIKVVTDLVDGGGVGEVRESRDKALSRNKKYFNVKSGCPPLPPRTVPHAV